jgi:hypothetical protein
VMQHVLRNDQRIGIKRACGESLLVRHAGASGEYARATACNVIRRFEPARITAATGASVFLPKLRPFFWGKRGALHQ